MTNETQGTAIIERIETIDLPALYSENKLEDTIKRIEEETLSIAPDLSTAAGRKDIRSLAHKISKSKTALDKAGMELTEANRKAIDKVNAERKGMRERLDALRDKIRKPVEDFEAAEEKRKDELRKRFDVFNMDRCDWQSSSDELLSLIDEINAIDIDDSWAPMEEMAEIAKSEALKKYNSDMIMAKGREDQAAELEKLRAEAAEREAKDREEREVREAKEAQERAERQAEQDKIDAEAAEIEATNQRAKDMIEYIKQVSNGFIGGQAQAYGILLYELETKIVIDDSFGMHKEAIEAVRDAAVTSMKNQMEADKERHLAEEKAKAEKDKADAQAQVEADLKRKAEDEAREKERLLAEEKRTAEKRENNKRHRNKIEREIMAAFAAEFPEVPAQQAIAKILMKGEVPHVSVSF